jgi:hypothetical protein
MQAHPEQSLAETLSLIAPEKVAPLSPMKKNRPKRLPGSQG